MRKLLWVMASGAILLIATVMLTPLRYVVFTKPLTLNQQAILRRANTGLAVLAIKSPTANRYYQEAQRSGRWSRFMTVTPTRPDSLEPGKAFSITVMAGTTVDMIAFYLHLTKSICFIESDCESLGIVPLGLTFAHELGHRDDALRGLVKISDLPSSQAFREGEGRARLLEITILEEYTAGRFSQAVQEHLKAFRQLPTAKRRRQRPETIMLRSDFAWVQQEFGALTPNDQRNIVAIILRAASLQKILAGRPTSAQDSLAAVVSTMEKLKLP